MSAKTTQKGQKRQTNGKTTIRERLQKAIRRLVLLSIVSLVIVSMIMNLSGTLSRLKADMQEIAKLDCDGYAIGGLAVGEPAEVMYEIIDAVEPHMPKDKPRYLMGVGTPTNIIEAVHLGVDFFDCVMPSRNGRHGKLFTWEGTVNILNEKYQTDPRPISESCGCPVCRNYSRAYLRHLFKADEVLALRLAVLHNLYFYNDLMVKIRAALDAGTFEEFRARYSGKLEQRVQD